jgi:ribosomal protein S12 methylthiotransferase
MRKNTIDIITLGCSKNLVDSEKLMKQLEANGYKVTHDSDHPQGEIAVINTCGFIGDAKEESINMILEFCQAKEEGRLKKTVCNGLSVGTLPKGLADGDSAGRQILWEVQLE